MSRLLGFQQSSIISASAKCLEGGRSNLFQQTSNQSRLSSQSIALSTSRQIQPKATLLKSQSRSILTASSIKCHPWISSPLLRNSRSSESSESNNICSQSQYRHDSSSRRTTKLLWRTEKILATKDDNDVETLFKNIISLALWWRDCVSIPKFSQKNDDQSRRRNREAAERCEDLLEHAVMEFSKVSSSPELMMQSSSDLLHLYNVSIDVWAKTALDDCGDRAEAILNRMLHRRMQYESNLASDSFSTDLVTTWNSPPSPCILTYNSVLHAWCCSPKDQEALDAIESILSKLEQQQHNRGLIRPDATTYNTVIGAYAERAKITPNSKIGIRPGARAERAESLLLHMSKLGASGDSVIFGPGAISFNGVLKAWSNVATTSVGHLGAIQRAEKILRTMVRLSSAEPHQQSDDSVRPNSKSFYTVISSYARYIHFAVDNGMDMDQRQQFVDRALSLLNLMVPEEIEELNNPTSQMVNMFGDDITPCFNAAINAIAKSRLDDAGEQAKSLLRRMHQCYLRQTKRKNGPMASFRIFPNIVTYTSVMDAIFRSSNNQSIDAARECDAMLMAIIQSKNYDRVENLEEITPLVKLNPTATAFHVAMVAWSKVSSIQSAKQVDRLLAIMEGTLDTKGRDGKHSEYDSRSDVGRFNQISILPTKSSYELAIEGYYKVKDDLYSAAVGAMDVLNRMEHAFRQRGIISAGPGGYAYNAVISKWVEFARNHDRLKQQKDRRVTVEAPNNALDILKRMERSEDLDARPDTITYNRVLHSLSLAGNYDAAEYCLELLSSMQHQKRQTTSGKTVSPDGYTYSTILAAWGNLDDRYETYDNRQSRGRKRYPPLVAMELLQKMDNDDLFVGKIIYEQILRILTKYPTSEDAVRNALSLWDRMETESKNNARIRPTCVEMNQILRMLASTTPPGAQKFLIDQICKYQEDPSSFERPNQLSFNIVLRAWAKSGSPIAGTNAEKLLRLMNSLNKANNVNKNNDSNDGEESFLPDRVTYNSVILALGNSGEATRAQQIFDFLDDASSKNEGDNVVRPNNFTFNSLINAWARSNEPDKHIKARDLLNAMIYRANNQQRQQIKMNRSADESDSVAPDIVTFNMVLNACASAAVVHNNNDDIHQNEGMNNNSNNNNKGKGNTDPLNVAFQVFDELLHKRFDPTLHPNAITYRTMLKVCKNHTDQNSDEGMKERIDRGGFIVAQCRRDGLMSQLVRKEISAVIPNETTRKMEWLDGHDLDQLPFDWIRNVQKYDRS